MDKEKLNYYRNKLLKERKSMENTLNRMEENEPNASQQEYFDELSLYDNHPADMGTETFIMEQAMNLKRNEEYLIDEIENALGKIDRGEYGKCDICGKDIEEERLDILPYANTCIDCTKETRHEKIDHDIVNHLNMDIDRPVEEDVLKYPFSRTFNDETDVNQTAFDGEDSLQSVEIFNKVKDDPSNKTGDDQAVFDEIDYGIVEDTDKITNQQLKRQVDDSDE
ncbi:TraR/DksA C4-type zinc finger protein [Thermohalobacter berrensis]|uniref:Zinc finger DksA/TraR C4-type domain-containing protein n=1 Tax=Thermohalobacter berrensis TaxID=99594 RepID=A0A419TA58_9FIRM|nr:TraR/DksA C4-type zinc finger protein [Thermohalobacter berrensis]RKD34337.1 hypothetical protein BET03_00450 [Thermohalobacter berrensis]